MSRHMTPRVTAFLTGAVLALTLIFLLPFLFGTDSRLMFPLLIGAYGVVGGILGFRSPEKGWRLGVWLVAFWLVLAVGNAFFVASDIPWEPTRENRNLMGHAMLIASAFAGAALGSFIKRNLLNSSFKMR
jgi:hypothetical protein